MTTIFYKVQVRPGDTIFGDLIAYAQNQNIGLVGRGFTSLSFRGHQAEYFSFTPGQIQHSSVKEKSENELIEKFEKQLDKTKKEWKRFDLEELLKNV